MFIDFIIGGIGGIVSRSAVAPIELNRIQKQNYFIPNATLSDVYKKEGFRHFWKKSKNRYRKETQKSCFLVENRPLDAQGSIDSAIWAVFE